MLNYKRFTFNYRHSVFIAFLNITYTARHTFATTITLANKVPLQDVSVMLGHASTRMTQHYARVLNPSLKEAMDNVKMHWRSNSGTTN